MSDTFEIDVRGLLARRVAEAPTAHAWSEVERRATDPDRPAPSGGRSPAVVWLAIAAAIVLVVAGAIAVLGDDDGSVVIEQGPATTVAEPTEPTTVDEEGADEDEPAVEETALDDDAPNPDESGPLRLRRISVSGLVGSRRSSRERGMLRRPSTMRRSRRTSWVTLRPRSRRGRGSSGSRPLLTLLRGSV